MLAPHGVELRVHEDPALLLAVPVFDNPMVLQKTGIEVGSEAAAGPGGDALVAEHRQQQHDELAAPTQRSVTHRAFVRQLVGIEDEDVVEDRISRATVDFSEPLLRRIEAVEVFGYRVIQNESLHYRDKFIDG